MAVKHTNRATSLLASNINASVTSLSVTAATGGRFPSLSGSDWFPLVVVAADGSYEIMRATARSGDVITVTRAQEGTSALSFNAGARVDLRLTSAMLADIVSSLETAMDDLDAAITADVAAALANVLSIGDTIKGADGTVAAPGLTLNSELSSGLYRVSAGNLGFSILGSQRALLSSVGFTWLGSTFAGSDLSPTAISTDQNNYNPPGLGLILTLGSITGGASYTTGSYTNVSLTGGAGTGAKADITVAGGVVTAVTITNRGINYVAGNTLSALAADIGGTGAGFSVPVATVDALTGSCLRLNVTSLASMTGLAGGAAGREIEMLNVGTATLKIPANSASSSVGNRFATTVNLVPGQSCIWRYDATASLWKLKNSIVPVAAGAPAFISNDLLIVNNTGSPDTIMDITASEAVLTDSNGNAIKFENVSVSVNSANTGAGGCDVGTRAANTDYYIWLESDGVTITGILHAANANAPTLPANYLYRKRIGFNHTDASSNFRRIRQNGQDAQILVVAGSATPKLPVIDSGAPKGTYSTTTPTWAAASLTGFIPSTARKVRFAYSTSANGGNPASALIAPTNAYGGPSSANPPPYARGNDANICETLEWVVESLNVYWAVTSVGSPGAQLGLLGWSDSN